MSARNCKKYFRRSTDIINDKARSGKRCGTSSAKDARRTCESCEDFYSDAADESEGSSDSSSGLQPERKKVVITVTTSRSRGHSAKKDKKRETTATIEIERPADVSEDITFRIDDENNIIANVVGAGCSRRERRKSTKKDKNSRREDSEKSRNKIPSDSESVAEFTDSDDEERNNPCQRREKRTPMFLGELQSLRESVRELQELTEMYGDDESPRDENSADDSNELDFLGDCNNNREDSDASVDEDIGKRNRNLGSRGWLRDAGGKTVAYVGVDRTRSTRDSVEVSESDGEEENDWWQRRTLRKNCPHRKSADRTASEVRRTQKWRGKRSLDEDPPDNDEETLDEGKTRDETEHSQQERSHDELENREKRKKLRLEKRIREEKSSNHDKKSRDKRSTVEKILDEEKRRPEKKNPLGKKRSDVEKRSADEKRASDKKESRAKNRIHEDRRSSRTSEKSADEATTAKTFEDAPNRRKNNAEISRDGRKTPETEMAMQETSRAAVDPRLLPNSRAIVLLPKLKQAKRAKAVTIVEPPFLPAGERRAACSNVVIVNKSPDERSTLAESKSSPAVVSTSSFYGFSRGPPQPFAPRLSKKDLAQKNRIERKIHVRDQKRRRVLQPWADILPISKQPPLKPAPEEIERIKSERKERLRRLAERKKSPGIEERTKNSGIEERTKSSGIEERTKSSGIEERTKSSGIEERTKSSGIEERTKSSGIEERTKILGIEERTKSSGIEERTKILGIEERTKILGIEERTKILGIEERTKSSGIEERTKSSGIEERTKILGIEERTKILGIEERTKILGIEERTKIPGIEEDSPNATAKSVSEAKRAEETTAKRVVTQSVKVTNVTRGYFLLCKPLEKRAKLKAQRTSPGKMDEREKENSDSSNVEVEATGNGLWSESDDYEMGIENRRAFVSPRVGEESLEIADGSTKIADGAPRIAEGASKIAIVSPRIVEDSTRFAEDAPRIAEGDSSRHAEEDFPINAEEDLPITAKDFPIITDEDWPRIAEYCSTIAEDCSIIAEDCPIIAEDCPIIAEDCPIIAEDCPIIAEDCPIIAEDCPIIAEDCPIIAEDCPIIADDWLIIDEVSSRIAENSPLIAENLPIIAENSPIIAENSPVIAENSPVIAENSPVIAEKLPVIAENSPIIAKNSTIIAENSSIIAENSSIIAESLKRVPEESQASRVIEEPEVPKKVRRVSFDDSATKTHVFHPPLHTRSCNEPRRRWELEPRNNDWNMPVDPALGKFLCQIFEWNPNWLEEQHHIKGPPPVVAEDALVAMLPEYRTFDEYYRTVEPILALEMWYRISRDYEEEKRSPWRYSIHRSDIEVFPVYGANLCMSIMKLESADSEIVEPPAIGDLVIFNYTPKRRHERGFPVFAYVASVQRGVWTVLTKPLVDMDHRRADLQPVAYIRPDMRLIQALRYLPESPLGNIILHPRLEDCRPPVASNLKGYPLVTKDCLNARQLEAVARITAAVTQELPRICLIQGPPGTGKSRVIVNLITQLIHGEHQLGGYKKMRILMCAPSNAAVDEVVLRLLNVNKTLGAENLSFNLVRIGRPDMMNPLVKEVSLKELARKQVDQMDRRMGYHVVDRRPMNAKISEEEKYLLIDADVIACTLNSCLTENMESMFGRSELISVCIVDEATQCVEPETLIPLMLGVKTLVLVGDTNQLPATVVSQEAKEMGLHQSLFARISGILEREPENPIIKLDTQYRMSNPVALFPNRHFYDGELKNAAIMRKLPLHFYRVFNLNSRQNSDRFSNSNEANFVANLMYTLIARANYDEAILPVKVGVITPYNNQKKLLIRRISERISCLKNQKKIDYEVNTVDSFQGQERDIVIMSCVRSNGIGFLADRQRLCVALTRAKHSLILCGNFRTFENNPMWKALLQDAKDRKVYVNLQATTNPNAITAFIVR